MNSPRASCTSSLTRESCPSQVLTLILLGTIYSVKDLIIINPDTVQTSSSLHICFCCSTIKTQLATITTSIKSEISSVQTQIYAQGSTPNLFAKDVATISYPFTGTISTTSSSLTVKLEKIRILKSLFANKNGLEMAIKAIRTATTSTSTTGATGNVKERKALIFPLFKCRCNNHIQSSIN